MIADSAARSFIFDERKGDANLRKVKEENGASMAYYGPWSAGYLNRSSLYVVVQTIDFFSLGYFIVIVYFR